MFKIFRNNCCGLDVHKTWIYACIGITDPNGRTEYKQARFSSFSKGLRELAAWLAKYSCTEVCMESTGKYWIPVFNILEKSCYVTLAHPKYTKPQKGNKTDRKDAKWICDLFMCDMIKPSFYPFSGNPAAPGSGPLSRQTYQYAHRRKEPGPELPDCFPT